ncbi:hypothetical protein R6Q57_005096 [Mikania cordata]
MKNRYDYLKAKFLVWTKLKNKTGNDSYTIIIFFFTRSKKHAEALRSAPLVYLNLCVQLSEVATSNGFDSWGPSSTLPHPFEDVFEYNLNNFEDIECTQMDPPLKFLVKSR